MPHPTRIIGETERRAATAEADRKAAEFERKYGHLRVAEESESDRRAKVGIARIRQLAAEWRREPVGHPTNDGLPWCETCKRFHAHDTPHTVRKAEARAAVKHRATTSPGSLPDKVMEAARSLSRQIGDGTFSQNALIMKAWEMFPDDFCLEGYLHPNSNKVIYCLCGDKGLVSRGFLRRVGKGLLEVV